MKMTISEIAFNLVSTLGKYILIANFYNKEHIELFMNTELTEKQYQKIVRWCNNSDICSHINSTTKQFLLDNQDEIIEILEEE